MTIVQAITIFLNYRGDGLKNYESTFSTYLIKSTLGIMNLIQEITIEILYPVLMEVF